jgi:hypothetical protein
MTTTATFDLLAAPCGWSANRGHCAQTVQLAQRDPRGGRATRGRRHFRMPKQALIVEGGGQAEALSNVGDG